MNRPEKKDLIDTAQAADEIGVSPETMARWRRAGYGPSFLQLGPSGRKKLYLRSEVRAWMARQMRRPEPTE
ncbi:helix-turn-helix transcriptional regulator [Jiella sp. M17.18]|uniref:helix-turn-helix transcriptional regulator n=1 Tax=Jiella sp. M17.18 TaxID=3234247 RepID=UPI0034DE8B36